jgi:hypothetical protein
VAVTKRQVGLVVLCLIAQEGKIEPGGA